ncbi:VOC family protein [Rhizobiaceae bacterium BDR2-2]|uniref:VOC family protein n=1 Tax=Ectorhizobium quercum TaxID=2965071 RepID=A0AAE3N3A5_9HYPH|nr:VOC family protein [Ectorhizobium quercum]MCX8998520.1 VOC family protein [Ectorhizobium quercum]
MPEDFGQFIWYELMTTDVEAAARFYTALTGWSAKTLSMPSMDYTILELPGQPVGVGGIMELQAIHKAEGIPPNWSGYISVDDVDLCAAELVMLGGSIRRQPEDIPGVGRLAVAADPHGAVFILFALVPEADAPPCATPGVAGTIGWHELLSGPPEEAFPFYEKLFGWKKADTIDMGEMGAYQLFAIGDKVSGGMMQKPADAPMAYWAFYISVPALDAAVETLTAGGGTVVFGPQEVPGGDFIVQATDPQGAYFCLVAPKR